MSDDVRVIDVPDRERFEILDGDGALAGFAEYRRRQRLIAFTHTEIDDAHEGQGLGSRLIEAALDEARAEHLAVLPFCPFVNRYIERHPEYVDLVPEAHRGEFGL